jgi:hypothetical protein
MSKPRAPKRSTSRKPPKHSTALVPSKRSKWEAAAELAREGYRDAGKKPVREAGDLVALLLVPLTSIVAALVWRVADGSPILEGFRTRMATKLAKIDPSHRRAPPKTVAGPLLLHYPFVAEDEELRDLFENLLTSAMSTKGDAHPAFVETLKQMTGSEARVVKALPAIVREWGDSLPMLRVTSRRKRTDGSDGMGGNEVDIVTDLHLSAGVAPPVASGRHRQPDSPWLLRASRWNDARA